MENIVVLIVLCFVIIYQAVIIALNEKRHTQEKKELLNRILSRNVSEYVDLKKADTEIENSSIKSEYDRRNIHRKKNEALEAFLN